MREKKRKDKREDRKEAVRQSRGMIKISSLLLERDLRVCEARLQASPRRVRKPRSGWRVVRDNPSVGLRRQLPLHKGAVILPDNRSFFCLFASHVCADN